MARKPYSFEDLSEQIERKITITEALDMLKNQKIIKTAFACWNDLEKTDLSQNLWWRIFLKKEQVELLIDTQGYNYPRYAGMLDKKAE